MMTTRMLPKGSKLAKHTVNGRSYDASIGFQDVPDHDANVLQANGWLRAGQVGVTSGRPSVPLAGQMYIDTTVPATVQWDGSNWINILTGAAA